MNCSTCGRHIEDERFSMEMVNKLNEKATVCGQCGTLIEIRDTIAHIALMISDVKAVKISVGGGIPHVNN